MVWIEPSRKRYAFPSHAKALAKALEDYYYELDLMVGTNKPYALMLPDSDLEDGGTALVHGYGRTRGMPLKRVVFLSSTDNLSFPGLSLYTRPSFKSTLEEVPVDQALMKSLCEQVPCVQVPAHNKLHALSLHVSFLLHFHGDFSIVPILLSGKADQSHADLGRALADLLHEDDLVIALSNLNKMLCCYRDIEGDLQSIQKIQSGNIEQVLQGLEESTFNLTGGPAVVAAMAYAAARGVPQGTLLNYTFKGRPSVCLDTALKPGMSTAFMAIIYERIKRQDEFKRSNGD